MVRDCDLEELDPCTIVTIKPCKKNLPKIQADNQGNETRQYEFHILVGGPDPCDCGDVIKELAYAFEPTSFDEVELLREGETYTDFFGRVFVCRDVSMEPESADCRKWRAVATVDNTCNNNPWYKVDGTLITTREELLEAAARITMISEDEKEVVQFAQFGGVYDGRGLEGECVFPSSSDEDPENPTCYPLQKMVKGKAYPVMNAAGVAVVPALERDSGNLTLVISKPYTGVNGCQVRKMRNRINCDPYRICEYIRGYLTFGIEVGAKCSRIMDITMDNATFCDGSPIKIVNVKVAIRRNVIETLDDDGNIMESEDFGWDDLIANKGYGELIRPGDADGFGGSAEENPPGASPVREIMDRAGNPVADPQWLGCHGRTYATDIQMQQVDDAVCVIGVDPDWVLYLRWQKYLDMVFVDDSNLPGFTDTVFFYVDPEDPQNEFDFPPGWIIEESSESSGFLAPFACIPIVRCGDTEDESSGEPSST